MRFRARATSNSARRGPPMKPSPMAGWTSGSEEGCGMGIIEGVIGPLGKLIDRVIPDPEARDRAKLELIRLEGSQEMEALKTQLSAIVAEAQSSDAWTSRARDRKSKRLNSSH